MLEINHVLTGVLGGICSRFSLQRSTLDTMKNTCAMNANALEAQERY